MTRYFLRDFDGRDRLRGVWVWDDEDPDRDPEIAYVDEEGRLEAEDMLASFYPPEGLTWLESMEYLVEKSHWQYRRRQGVFPTELDARELLAQTQQELSDGRGVDELSGVPET